MISIVLAADKNYFYQLMVTIASILENKDSNTDVEFYIFIDQDYSSQDKDRIDNFLKSKGTQPAHFLDVSDIYADTDPHHDRITTAAYYRLKIPSSLLDKDKCIYLDVDTLVCKDLTDLYECSLEDSYLAGVLAAGYQEDENYKCRKAQVLGIPSMDTYLNSGVLVINLARMRQDNLEARFDQLLAEEFPDHDQDILNAACYGSIKLLPPEYNAMTKYEFEDNFYEIDKAIPKCWSKWQWDKARKDPTIVHFADQDKPWTNFAVPFAKAWWHYAEIAGVAKECFDTYFDTHAANEVKIRKLSIEKRQSELVCECAQNEKTQALRDREAIQGKLEETDKARQKAQADLSAQQKLTQETEAKLTLAQQAHRQLDDKLTLANSQIVALDCALNTLQAQKEQLAKQKTDLSKQVKKAQAQVEALKTSNSYRLGRTLSAPYRWLKRVCKR